MRLKFVGKQIEYVRHKDVEFNDLPHLDADQIRLFRPVLSFLNTKDRDILYLIFVSKKKQHDVRRILRRPQSTLCCDIKRIRQRLKFIYYLQSVFDIFIEFLLSERAALFTPQELEVLTMMFYTSSFSVSSKILELSQARARYVFDKCVRRMEECKMWSVYEIFTNIAMNLNIVRRWHKWRNVVARDAPVWM